MPRKPRHTKKRKNSELTDAQIEFLIRGRNIFTQVEPPFKNEGDIADVMQSSKMYGI